MYICIVAEKLYQNTLKDIQTMVKITCGFVRVNWIFTIKLKTDFSY